METKEPIQMEFDDMGYLSISLLVDGTYIRDNKTNKYYKIRNAIFNSEQNKWYVWVYKEIKEEEVPKMYGFISLNNNQL